MASNLEQYRYIFLLCAAIAVPTLLLVQSITTGGPYSRIGYPLLALCYAWLAWALLMRRHRVAQLMKWSFGVTAIFWLGLMAFRLYGNVGVDSVQRLSPTLYMVFIALAITAHLVFSTRTALALSLAILATTILLSLGWLVGKAESGAYLPAFARLLSYEAVLAVSILLLYALARNKDDYAAALLEAERLRSMAYSDVLTDLPNRRRLEEDLERHLSIERDDEHPLSVILFDIDHFKDVNDAHGHHVGDLALEETGRLVRSLLRSGDVFGRWGGEEFLIIAPETGEQEARALAERVRRGIEAHEFGNGLFLTASFGVATRAEGAPIDHLVREADETLYHAKRAGRNRISVASKS